MIGSAVEAVRPRRAARPRRLPRLASTVLTCAIGLAGMVWLGGCGDSGSSRNASVEGPGSVAAVGDFAWPPIDDAVSYRVRGWADARLLFTERTYAARLSSTPALERSIAPFPKARLRVQALDGSDTPIGAEIELTMEEARSVQSREAPR